MSALTSNMERSHPTQNHARTLGFISYKPRSTTLTERKREIIT
ncbi:MULTISPECIES: hypothetical protein [unclassified Microcoleus]